MPIRRSLLNRLIGLTTERRIIKERDRTEYALAQLKCAVADRDRAKAETEAALAERDLALANYFSQFNATNQVPNENSPPWGLQQARYEIQLLELRLSPYATYPRGIQFETLVQCNAACSFCPYTTFKRKGDKMSDDLIEKVLSDLKDIPKTVPIAVIPHCMNEPFLDVRMWDILERLSRDFRNVTISMTTNVSPLTSRNIERLKKIGQHGRIGTIVLSLNEYRAAEYENLMKIPFRRTMEAAKELHALKASNELGFHVHVSRVGTGTDDDQRFLDWCKVEFPAFTASVMPRVNWLGMMDGYSTPPPKLRVPPLVQYVD